MARSKVTLDMVYDLLKEHVEKDSLMFKEIQQSLDGCDEYPGVRGRLDRLEQSAKRLKWGITTALGAVITGAISWLLSVIRSA